MKVVGVAGSTRPKGNTLLLVEEALSVCRDEGLETELINLAERRVDDCTVCHYCSRHPGLCCQTDDLPSIYQSLKNADAVVLASPVYYSSITGKMKSLIDRVGTLSGSEGRVFERKIGGSIAVARRAGQITAYQELNAFLLHQGMIIPGSTYWNISVGRQPGDVLEDVEGLNTVRNFAANLCWLAKKLV